MKTALKIWLGISLMLLIMIGWALLDVLVSLKYEIDEVCAGRYAGEYIKEKEFLLNKLAFALKFFGGYLIVNVIIIVRWLAEPFKT